MKNRIPTRGVIRAGEAAIATSQGREANIPERGTIRVDQNF